MLIGILPSPTGLARRYRPSAMWKSQIETLSKGCVRVRTFAGDRPLSYADTLELWIAEAPFCDWFTDLLRDAPFEAYCWECPPVTLSSLDRDFEFVLVDVPELDDLPADPQPFAEQFSASDLATGVADFSNLGGDARLIAPLPIDANASYSHFAAFLRSAPRTQCHALWQAVGTAITERVGDAPLWVSTAGLGVSWLHIRLDSYPKYYRFAAYRS